MSDLRKDLKRGDLIFPSNSVQNVHWFVDLVIGNDDETCAKIYSYILPQRRCHVTNRVSMTTNTVVKRGDLLLDYMFRYNQLVIANVVAGTGKGYGCRVYGYKMGRNGQSSSTEHHSQ